MKADAKTNAEVMAVLNQLIKAYKEQDVDGCWHSTQRALIWSLSAQG